MPVEARYSIERVTDRHWVVLDMAREGRQIGRAGNETGAHRIVSLIRHLRSAPVRIETLRASGLEAA
jgi:hypothetical protein